MTAADFMDLLEAAEFEPSSYSGRGMYGRRCVSVTVDPAQALAVGSAVALAAASDEEREGIHQIMTRTRQDGMGRDVVIYWPDLEWPGEEEGDR